MTDAQGTRNDEWSVGRGACLALVVSLLLTILMAAPVVRAPSERIFGNGEILSADDPNRDPLVVIEQFRTGRVAPPYLQPLTDWSGQILARALGPVAAYNFIVLITFPFAAVTAYLLARYLLDSHLAALVTGLAYAFLPFHVLQAGGHPHIAQTQWLPLYLLALFRCIDQPGPARAILLLLCAAAAVLADFYGGFIVAVLSPVALLAYGITSPRHPEGQSRRLLTTTLILLTAAMAGLGLIRYFAPAILSQPSATAFARSDLFTWSARWWSYLIPPADHPLWGSVIREFWVDRGLGVTLLEHQQVSLSLSLVALSFIPLWRWVRGRRETPAERVMPVLVVIAATALLCSLSPERRIGSFDFIRPSALLYEMAPMFRAYARFGGVVGLMTSLLAGAGVEAALRSSRRGRVMAAAFLGLTVLEYAPLPPWRSRDVLPTAAHRWISARPGAMRVLDCVEPLRASDTVGASLLGHEVSTLGRSGFDDCGEPHLGQKLFALGYTDVIVRRDTRVGTWLSEEPRRFSALGSLRSTMGFEDSFVLTPEGDRPDVHLASWSGFYPREYEGPRTWRWMREAGTLRLKAARSSSDTVLELDLRSFPEDRRADWSVNGKKLGELTVTTDWRSYALALGPITAAEIALSLVCHEPAVGAAERLHNHDLRPLGLAVGTWRIRGARD